MSSLPTTHQSQLRLGRSSLRTFAQVLLDTGKQTKGRQGDGGMGKSIREKVRHFYLLIAFSFSVSSVRIDMG